jgi:hypothetical protein
MATNTYVALDKVTVSGTSTTSVTISGISGAYTDLRLVINSQNQNSTNQPYIQFNADTSTGSTNYSTTSLRGDGSSAASGRHTNQNGWYPVPGPGVGTTGNFEPWLVDIMNYSNTTTYKSGLSRFNNASSIVSANVHLWRSTAAITSITITAESGAGYLVPGSTFTIYGIKSWAAETTPKATGGYVYSDSSYYYHVFPFSGTFTPNQSLTADVLVVAGGGGGGGDWAGGGGAGGYLTFSSQSLTATGYTCTVGAGGSGATSTSVSGAVGADSQFGALTLVKGGGFGAKPFVAGGTGGSGGGGGYGGNSGGSATSGQGFAGGSSGSDSGAPGGGGAGQVGASVSNPNTTNGGKGGDGLTTAISGGATTGFGQLSSGNYYFAGGGGGRSGLSPAVGGAGGVGGGGTGGTYYLSINGTSGQVSTGGGGGGGANNGGYAGNGGSGVVIVRYAK